jgi:hypothetical protein
MDEAFLPLGEVLRNLLSFAGEVRDDDAGVRTHVTRCEIETPVELDVSWDADGRLRVGSVPPLYYVDTTFRPSFHRVRFTATADREDDDAR